jgi:hypothetical protein
MGLLIRRPLSAGELLDLSFAVARRHLFVLLGLGGVPLAAAVLLDIGLRIVGAGPDAELLAVIPTLACMGVAEGRMIVAAWQLIHGEPLHAEAARRLVRARLLPVMLGYTIKWVLGIVGLFFFLLPGVYMLLRWFAIPTVTMLEQRGLRDSFRRSRTLGRGHKWRLLGTVGVFDLAVFLLSMGILWLYSDGVTGETPLWADGVGWVLSVLLVPIRATLMVAVYTEIRVRDEAYDVEAAASALAAS